jgi:hypothetical protein
MDLVGALGLGGAKALVRSLATNGDGKLRVISLDEHVARCLEQAGHSSLLARVENSRLNFEDAPADALCLSSLPNDASLMRECARAVRPGGRVLVASGMATARKERHLVMALLLHAGLVDLEQHWSRGILISSGRVRV